MGQSKMYNFYYKGQGGEKVNKRRKEETFRKFIGVCLHIRHQKDSLKILPPTSKVAFFNL